MTKREFIKGHLIKTIMEILKSEYDVKSPTPHNLSVEFVGGEWKIKYTNSRLNLEFSKVDKVKRVINEIKNNPLYEGMRL